MTDFRIRWRKAGAHVHARVFSAPRDAATYALNGELVFRDDGEWASFVQCLKDHGQSRIMVLPEDGKP